MREETRRQLSDAKSAREAALQSERIEAGERFSKLTQQSKSQLEEERAKAARKLQEEMQNASRQRAEMEEQHAMSMDTTKLAHKKELQEINGKLAAVEAKLQTCEDRNRQQETALTKAEADLEALHRQGEEDRQRSEEQLASLRKTYEEEAKAASNQFADEMEDLRERHEHQCQELRNAISELEGSVLQWKEKFHMRPSREEDVELILSLQNDNAEKEALVKKTLEEMAYFKRELLNREELYNKKFNVSPVVGVMQVVKAPDRAGKTTGSGKGGRPPRAKHTRSMSLQGTSSGVSVGPLGSARSSNNQISR
jgi:uncharacterized phage infection (PIP) family protein YhgE